MQRNYNTIDLELEENRFHLEASRLQQQIFPIDYPFYGSLVQRENILLCIRANLIKERVNLIEEETKQIKERGYLIYGRVRDDEYIISSKF